MARSIEEILQDVRIDEIPLKSPMHATPETPLEEAYALLDASPHGAILVCEEDGIRGIFSERDVLYRTALEELDPTTPIGELMTPDPVSVAGNERVSEAIRMMTELGYRNLPLLDGDGCCEGLLASRDVLRFIADHFPEAVLNLPPRLHQQMLRPEGG
jgi:CBS domain-containing protein